MIRRCQSIVRALREYNKPPAAYCVFHEYSFSDVFRVAWHAVLNRFRNRTRSHLTYLYYTNNVIRLDYNTNIIITAGL